MPTRTSPTKNTPECLLGDDRNTCLHQSALLMYLMLQLDESLGTNLIDGEDNHELKSTLQIPKLPYIRRLGTLHTPQVARTSQRHEVVTGSVPRKNQKFSTLGALEDFYTKKTRSSALELLRSSLTHESELVRVSSAIACSRVFRELSMPISVLEHAFNSKDELTRLLARKTLFGLIPHHPQSKSYESFETYSDARPIPGTSLLVHGTFAEDRKSSWWVPGSRFHKFIKHKFADLYGNSGYYTWSGAYDHRARKLASQELIDWAKQYATSGSLNHVFAHSHGGNIAMLASHAGLHMEKLVLMGCPFQSRYTPNFKNINSVSSVRVRFDLAVLADMILNGGRFKPISTKITDIRLNVWFDHAKVHDPDVWIANNVLAQI